MKLFIIEIHWSRRRPMPGMPASGVTTARVRSSSLTKAIQSATSHFKRQHGVIHQIDRAAEKQDPAGIYAESARRDCGSGQDYGICPACGKGHGHVVMSSGETLQSTAL